MGRQRNTLDAWCGQVVEAAGSLRVRIWRLSRVSDRSMQMAGQLQGMASAGSVKGARSTLARGCATGSAASAYLARFLAGAAGVNETSSGLHFFGVQGAALWLRAHQPVGNVPLSELQGMCCSLASACFCLGCLCRLIAVGHAVRHSKRKNYHKVKQAASLSRATPRYAVNCTS